MGTGTDIGKVRGLGSAKHGGEHWLVQRVTAIGNILLTIWFAASLFLLPNFEHETLAAWLSQPLVAVPMILLLICVFWHIRLGLQVFIEDYVQDEGVRFGAMILLTFYTLGMSVWGIFMIAKTAFAGVPV